MKRRKRSSKTAVDKPKKPQGESKRKSCARKHRKKRNCVELRKSRKLNGPKSAKNGSVIKYKSVRLRKERERNAKDRIRLNSNEFVLSVIAKQRSKQS